MKNYAKSGEQLVYIWDTVFKEVADVGIPVNNLPFMAVIQSTLDQENIVYAESRYEMYNIGNGPLLLMQRFEHKNLPPPSITEE